MLKAVVRAGSRPPPLCLLRLLQAILPFLGKQDSAVFRGSATGGPSWPLAVLSHNPPSHSTVEVRVLRAEDLGLQLNRGKSEVICVDPTTKKSLLAAAPGLHVISPNHLPSWVHPYGTWTLFPTHSVRR